MPISDDQVATLRAQLVKDFDRFNQLVDMHEDGNGQAGYFALVTAGFFRAVEQRFPTSTTTVGEVVEYVADVRGRSEEARQGLEPDVAERLIRHAVGDDRVTVADIGDSAVRRTQVLLLGALIYDWQLTDSEVDAFLDEVRPVADRLID